MPNPFRDLYPEAMTNDTIKQLYVKDIMNVEDILNENHHIVWGSRGSGKSMLFRYINSDNPSTYSEIQNRVGYLSIYFKCGQGMLDISDFQLLNEYEAMNLTEHLLNMYITQAVVKTLNGIADIPIRILHNISSGIIESVFDFRIDKAIEFADSRKTKEEQPLEWLHLVTEYEIKNVQAYLRRINKTSCEYLGCYTGYHDYLLPMFETLQQALGNDNLRFFLLLDDAGKMYPFQQKIINNWIANRNHDIFSLKLSATRSEYVCFYTPNDNAIDPFHDYTETELDLVYCKKEDYQRNISEIIKKRFEYYHMEPIDPYDLFPSDSTQEKLIRETKEDLSIRFAKDVAEKNKISESTYMSRHLMPTVFQKLSEQRKNFIYSGFNTLVSLSSGVIRIFIEMGSRMYAEAQSMLPDGEPVMEIKPEIQNKVAHDFASDYQNRIPKLYKNSLSNPKFHSVDFDGWEPVWRTETLLNSLGSYFRDRLLNPQLSEQILFSFAVRNPSKMSQEVRTTLDLASAHSFLQKTVTSNKHSGIREDRYLLNRCLAPLYNIYTDTLKGRTLFSVEELNMAMTDTQEFMSKCRAKPRTYVDKTSGQMTFFPENEDDVVIDEDFEEERASGN